MAWRHGDIIKISATYLLSPCMCFLDLPHYTVDTAHQCNVCEMEPPSLTTSYVDLGMQHCNDYDLASVTESQPFRSPGRRTQRTRLVCYIIYIWTLRKWRQHSKGRTRRLTKGLSTTKSRMLISQKTRQFGECHHTGKQHIILQHQSLSPLPWPRLTCWHAILINGHV